MKTWGFLITYGNNSNERLIEADSNDESDAIERVIVYAKRGGLYSPEKGDKIEALGERVS